MELGNYSKAVRSLEALDSRFPFGPHKTQVQLDLIYAYYKMDDVASGIANIDRFIRLNPTHLILTMCSICGLVNMQADNYLFHDMLNIDRTDRDPKMLKMLSKILIVLSKLTLTANMPPMRKTHVSVEESLSKIFNPSCRILSQDECMERRSNPSTICNETYPGTPSNERALR